MIVDMAVHYQCEWSSTPDGVHGVQNSMEPGEVVEEVDGAGDVDREIPENVGEEDDVSWVAHDLAADLGVWAKNPLIDPLWHVLFVVPGEDGGLEVWMVWVVQGLQSLNGRLV